MKQLNFTEHLPGTQGRALSVLASLNPVAPLDRRENWEAQRTDEIGSVRMAELRYELRPGLNLELILFFVGGRAVVKQKRIALLLCQAKRGTAGSCLENCMPPQELHS